MTGSYWRLIDALIWISALLSAASVILLLFAPDGVMGLDDRTYATLAALLFGVFSFFLRSRQAELQSRKQHTIKILFETRMSSEFRSHLEWRKHAFPEGDRIDPDFFKACLTANRSTELSEDEAFARRKSAEAVRSLLNYYEFIALGLDARDLDEDMMRGSVRGMMCNLVQDCFDVISEYRRVEPRTYEHLVAVYERWRDPHDPSF